MIQFVIRSLLFGLFIIGNIDFSYGQEEGLASYYHNRFHGRKAASGYVHDNDDFVAAHRTLPFGTFVRVTNLKNMKSVIVSIIVVPDGKAVSSMSRNQQLKSSTLSKRVLHAYGSKLFLVRLTFGIWI